MSVPRIASHASTNASCMCIMRKVMLLAYALGALQIGNSVYGIIVWTLWLVGPYKQQTPPRNYFTYSSWYELRMQSAFIVHSDAMCLKTIILYSYIGLPMGQCSCTMTEGSVDWPSCWFGTSSPCFRKCAHAAATIECNFIINVTLLILVCVIRPCCPAWSRGRRRIVSLARRSVAGRSSVSPMAVSMRAQCFYSFNACVRVASLALTACVRRVSLAFSACFASLNWLAFSTCVRGASLALSICVHCALFC
jgi:hypothetical protein